MSRSPGYIFSTVHTPMQTPAINGVRSCSTNVTVKRTKTKDSNAPIASADIQKTTVTKHRTGGIRPIYQLTTIATHPKISQSMRASIQGSSANGSVINVASGG